jgi:hypothetical protein
MRATFCALAIATLVLALSACGDDSSGEKATTPTPEEQAQITVCNARADISAQVDELKGLTAATVTKDGVTQSLETIKKSLNDISGAQSQLSSDRRSEAEAATKTFTSSVQSIKDDFLTSVSASEAKTALVTALQQLATSFQTAFEPLNCS